jgi:hypothetical protein
VGSKVTKLSYDYINHIKNHSGKLRTTIKNVGDNSFKVNFLRNGNFYQKYIKMITVEGKDVITFMRRGKKITIPVAGIGVAGALLTTLPFLNSEDDDVISENVVSNFLGLLRNPDSEVLSLQRNGDLSLHDAEVDVANIFVRYFNDIADISSSIGIESNEDSISKEHGFLDYISDLIFDGDNDLNIENENQVKIKDKENHNNGNVIDYIKTKLSFPVTGS